LLLPITKKKKKNKQHQKTTATSEDCNTTGIHPMPESCRRQRLHRESEGAHQSKLESLLLVVRLHGVLRTILFFGGGEIGRSFDASFIALYGLKLSSVKSGK